MSTGLIPVLASNSGLNNNVESQNMVTYVSQFELDNFGDSFGNY